MSVKTTKISKDLLNSFLLMEILDGNMDNEKMDMLLKKYGVAFSYQLVSEHLKSINQRLLEAPFKKMFIKDETIALFETFKSFIEEMYPADIYPEKWI